MVTMPPIDLDALETKALAYHNKAIVDCRAHEDRHCKCEQCEYDQAFKTHITLALIKELRLARKVVEAASNAYEYDSDLCKVLNEYEALQAYEERNI